MANSLISMVKGDSTLINNTEVLNGQILFDETKQKIFLDDNAKRKEYGGSDDNAVKKDDVAYVESAMVATRGYSAGNYIIVQDTLYKATTQINSGTALVVGTNVSTTTVGNELTRINNDLTDKVSGFTETTYSAVTGLAYDSTNKKLGLKVGADTVIPFSGGTRWSIENTSECHKADQWYVPSTRGTYDVSAINSGTFRIVVTRYFGVTCIIKIDDTTVFNQSGGSGTYEYSINAKNVNTIYAQGYSTSIVYNP